MAFYPQAVDASIANYTPWSHTAFYYTNDLLDSGEQHINYLTKEQCTLQTIYAFLNFSLSPCVCTYVNCIQRGHSSPSGERALYGMCIDWAKYPSLLILVL